MNKCKKCISEIDDQAVICPHCNTRIKLLKSLRIGDYANIVIYTGIISFFSYILFDAASEKFNPSYKKASFTDLEAKVIQVNRYSNFDAEYSSCLAEIINPTDKKFRDLYMEVSLYDKESNLVDVYTTHDDSTRVPKNGSVKLRVRATATNHSATYARCEIRITDAKGK